MKPIMNAMLVWLSFMIGFICLYSLEPILTTKWFAGINVILCVIFGLNTGALVAKAEENEKRK